MSTCRSFNRRQILQASLAGAAIPWLSRATAKAHSDIPLHDMIHAHMEAARIPGLALAVARSGVVITARGYGFADLESGRLVTSDSMFHIASVTKPVTATAVMQLIEQERMGLDDAIDPFLDFAIRNPRHPDVPITFRHLLMHTSGISDERYLEVDFRTRGSDSNMDIGTLVEDCLRPGDRYYTPEKSFGPAVPGALWDYSNLGYALLGYLASRIAGVDMRDQATANIFAPLGMMKVSWTIAGTPPALRVTPYDVVDDRPAAVEPVAFPDWSSGMLRASVADFSLFLAATSDGGATATERIASVDTLRQMLNMQQVAGLPPWLNGQGLGWESSVLGTRSVIEHWGGDPGVFTAAYVEPATRTGVCIFTNANATTSGRRAMKEIAARLLAFPDGATTN